eukprot:1158988-Pelagomonas_calceolata.AAC.2
MHVQSSWRKSPIALNSPSTSRLVVVHGMCSKLSLLLCNALIRGDASHFKHIVSQMVAMRGAREGTPGAPLVAIGRRENFGGPPFVALLLLLVIVQKAQGEEEKQDEGTSLLI